MTTLTMMERTATGWKCPRCGSTLADDILPIRSAECNCYGLALPPILRKGWVTEETARAVENERLRAWEDAPGHAVASGSENASGHVFASGQLAEEDGE